MRRTALVLAFALLTAVGLGSCAKWHPLSVSPSSAGKFAPTAETGPYRVIGYLEHRDHVVTIKTGAQGTVYSARDKAGKTLFENLTAEQLSTQSPEIHDFIEAAIAGSARLDMKVREPAGPLITK